MAIVAETEDGMGLGSSPMTKRVILLFEPGRVTKLDAEDAVTQKGGVISGSYTTISEVLEALETVEADVVIAESSCLVEATAEQLIALAPSISSILAIAYEEALLLPTEDMNVQILRAPFTEADMSAALFACGFSGAM
jgi:hypothetical protein